MRRSAIGVVCILLALCAGPALAQDGSIEIFPYSVDPNGNALTPDFGACQAVPTPIFGGFGQKLIVGVFGRLSGVTAAGISGAELYVTGIEGLPAGWTTSVIYPASTIQAFSATAICLPRSVGGNLERRQNTTWTDVSGPDAATCQKDPLVELARIELQQVGQPPVLIPNNTRFRVVAGDPPGGALNCPLLVKCDFPVFTQVCVTGGEFLVNPSGTSCSVAVSEATWGAVKDLYR